MDAFEAGIGRAGLRIEYIIYSVFRNIARGPSCFSWLGMAEAKVTKTCAGARLGISLPMNKIWVKFLGKKSQSASLLDRGISRSIPHCHATRHTRGVEASASLRLHFPGFPDFPHLWLGALSLAFQGWHRLRAGSCVASEFGCDYDVDILAETQRACTIER